MSNVNNAVREVRRISAMAQQDKWLNRVHPLAKLGVTVLYIALAVSYTANEGIGLLGMSVYPITLFVAGDISAADSLKRLRAVLILVCAVGILNPFLDTRPAGHIGSITVSAGVVSMLLLAFKGVLSVLAAYLLMATTTVEKLCSGLYSLHMPKLLVTVILLTYRYITLLMEEAGRLQQAYALRAPGQRGIRPAAWGSLAGSLLLRSMDRAETVYESMCLRGFNGAFRVSAGRMRWSDLLYMIFWAVLLVLVRLFIFQ